MLFKPELCQAIADDIAIRMFARYWDSLHKPEHRWHKNPEVWVKEFKNIA